MTDASVKTATGSTKETKGTPTTSKPLTDEGQAARAGGFLKTLVDRLANTVTSRTKK